MYQHFGETHRNILQGRKGEDKCSRSLRNVRTCPPNHVASYLRRCIVNYGVYSRYKTRRTVTIFHCMYLTKPTQSYLDTGMNIYLLQVALNQPSCSSVPSLCYGQKSWLSQGVGFRSNFLRVKE
jgi:hypothetical protein